MSSQNINVKDDSGDIPLYRFWQPKFWLLWLGLGILRVLTWLPFPAQMKLGRALGRVLHKFMGSRRNIAAVNLRICYPEYNQNQIRDLVARHFESLGMSIFELALSWWATDQQTARLITVDGLENILKPLKNGQGVVLLSGHFSSTELTGRAVKLSIPDIGSMYRPMKNPMVDQLVRRGRSSVANCLIPKDDIRQMIRLLRQGWLVWYAPDQSYNRKYSAMVPFFGEPAMTNAALTQIARIGNACVAFYAPRRLANDAGYHVEISSPLDNFPTDDPEADALRVNQLLEEKIRQAPEQYYWIHRRFKNRPDPYPDPYGQSDGPATN